MPLPHLLLALAVVAVWGTNFVVIKWGLAELPPLLFTTLRFALSAFPLLLFIKRPAVPWHKLAGFGALHGLGLFGLMLYAMRADISPGLASLVIQTQVFFTIVLAMLLDGERPRPLQGLALGLAVTGMALIAGHIDQHSITALGLALVLTAALCWAGANMVARSVGRVDMLGFMVWISVFAAPALALLSLLIEGPARIVTSLSQASAGAWAAVAWQALGNTLFGYGAWNWLLARHPAATVAPAALLVPVFGMAASSLLLGESLPGWKLGATALVLGGLALNTLASRATRTAATPERFTESVS
ncbi:EamA family transporter [Methylibium sp. Pch-M]|uniref:EamA family transporter n=1 Tax=Methylibium sp. Pch-M TaxID=2082386 RepID=UPI001011E425|nr:EamA family transporter [Methylibium sp. Pch-M]QAZ39426.1 EamA family transporter [Methylibium sp. Pch-M]